MHGALGRAIAGEREFMVFDMVLVAAATFLAIGAIAAWLSLVGRAPRRREPSVEEDSTRKVVDWSGS